MRHAALLFLAIALLPIHTRSEVIQSAAGGRPDSAAALPLFLLGGALLGQRLLRLLLGFLLAILALAHEVLHLCPHRAG
jgi:hypothetical protein